MKTSKTLRGLLGTGISLIAALVMFVGAGPNAYGNTNIASATSINGSGQSASPASTTPPSLNTSLGIYISSYVVNHYTTITSDGETIVDREGACLFLLQAEDSALDALDLLKAKGQKDSPDWGTYTLMVAILGHLMDALEC